MFEREHIEALREIFTRVCESFDVQIAQLNGESDHTHLLVNFPSDVALSKLVNSLKGVSSRLLRKQFPTLEAIYLTNLLSSRSYFAASCGGAPLEIIRQYVEQLLAPRRAPLAEDKERTRKLERPWQPMLRGLPAR
jgi:putative transposase